MSIDGVDVSKPAFFITQVGPKQSAERERADVVYDHIVRPIAEGEPFGLEVVRADLDPTPGQVTAQIVRLVVEAPVVFADLTGRNCNVYYELAVAHSFRKRVVVLVDRATNLSFDTQNERVIEIGDDGLIGVNHAEHAKRELKRVIQVVLGESYTPDNLVTSAVGSQQFDALANDNPLFAEVASIREAVEATRKIVASDASRRSRDDVVALRQFIEGLVTEGLVGKEDLRRMSVFDTSAAHDKWLHRLVDRAPDSARPAVRYASQGYDEFGEEPF